jgi:DNA helicase IV
LTTPEVTHPEFESEQAFLTHAAECLRRMRHELPGDGHGGADPKAAAALKKHFDAVREHLENPETVLFGRIAFTDGEDLYVGPRGIRDNGELIIISWAARAARPFYEATPSDSDGLALRRRLRTERDRLLGIADEWFGEDAPEPTVGDILLDALARDRTGEMRQVAATIQRDQYRIMERSLDAPTIVQGGPGTGKTIVGLHRAALLLYRHRQQLTTRRVLIVGPNHVFMRYISYVLPSLGETAVDQVVVENLVDVRAGGTDHQLVARVKGDMRMVDILLRAVVDRVRAPTENLEFNENGIPFSLSAEAITELVGGYDGRSESYIGGRLRFRAAIERAVSEAYVAASRRYRPGEVPTSLPTIISELERALDRIWPSITAAELVRQLLSSEDRIERAADGILTDPEKRLLYRKPAERLGDVQWSTSDLPLIDEVQELIDPVARRYGHVIIDEAQDLTPMQLRVVGRRISEGAATVLGDLAQATGLWSYSTWGEVAKHLGIPGAEIEELIHAYRVPREIMEIALPVLALTAPSITAPRPFRDGDQPPAFAQVDRDEREAEAVRRAQAAHLSGGSAAIIAPQSLIETLRSELRASGFNFGDAEQGELATTIELLDPNASKGLEFDHVVLVEPAAIIREAAGGDGHRDLYVALTRATRTLTCLHAEPLPWPLGGRPLQPRGDEVAQAVGEPEPIAPQPSPAPPVAAISIGEALVVARMRGLDAAEALARALLAELASAPEEEISRAILDPSVYADAVRSLLEQLQTALAAERERHT